MRRMLVGAALMAAALTLTALVASASGSASELTTTASVSTPVVGTAVAFDTTPPLNTLKPVKPKGGVPANIGESGDTFVEQRPHRKDGALQEVVPAAAMPAPQRTFEGPSNEDNFRVFGFRVNPPDPVGDVGPKHYVAMTNLTFAVYSKQGRALFGPADTGRLWQGFAVDDCTDPSGDPIVVYDEIADRWILTQFTTRGLVDKNQPFFNCVAVSQTDDPTGAYFRYAFTTGQNFPDYPKYGVMPNGLFITAREFRGGNETIGIYAINREQLVAGNPNVLNARSKNGLV